MGATKKSLEEYVDELANWDVTSREEAAEILGDIGDESVIEPLLSALKKDKSEDVRAAAARSLGKLEIDKKTANTLTKILDIEKSPIVRVALTNAIAVSGNFASVEMMIPILEKEDSGWVKEAIIEAFGKTKPEAFKEILLDYLKNDPSEEVRIQAASAIMQKPDIVLLDTILDIFKAENNDNVRSHIVEIIAELPDSKSVDILTAVLDDDENSLTQAAASEALHKIALALGYKDENEMMDSL